MEETTVKDKKFCACGCGKEIQYWSKRWNRPRMFYKFHHLKKQNNPNWIGGILVRRGYVYVSMPNHPFANCGGYVAEHRLVMEKKIDRYLDQKEVVHHINGNKKDNRIENLQLYESHSKHFTDHNPRHSRY